jgi:hypothetical protein
MVLLSVTQNTKKIQIQRGGARFRAPRRHVYHARIKQVGNQLLVHSRIDPGVRLAVDADAGGRDAPSQARFG